MQRESANSNAVNVAVKRKLREGAAGARRCPCLDGMICDYCSRRVSTSVTNPKTNPEPRRIPPIKRSL